MHGLPARAVAVVVAVRLARVRAAGAGAVEPDDLRRAAVESVDGQVGHGLPKRTSPSLADR